MSLFHVPIFELSSSRVKRLQGESVRGGRVVGPPEQSSAGSKTLHQASQFEPLNTALAILLAQT